MIININFSDFINAFDRFDRRDNFTLSGLSALFNYLEDIEQDTGQPIELDVIALCCDYIQDSWVNVTNDHNIVPNEDDHGSLADTVLEYLEDETMVIYHDDDTVLYQSF